MPGGPNRAAPKRHLNELTNCSGPSELRTYDSLACAPRLRKTTAAAARPGLLASRTLVAQG